jgi:hypothetical protein
MNSLQNYMCILLFVVVYIFRLPSLFPLLSFQTTEALVLGEVRRIAGSALLPPLLAQLRSLVARDCGSAHPSGSNHTGPNHENPVVVEQWRDVLAVWRTSEAILVANGKPATGFVHLS